MHLADVTETRSRSSTSCDLPRQYSSWTRGHRSRKSRYATATSAAISIVSISPKTQMVPPPVSPSVHICASSPMRKSVLPVHPRTRM